MHDGTKQKLQDSASRQFLLDSLAMNITGKLSIICLVYDVNSTTRNDSYNFTLTGSTI